jgi:sulfonate transport system substrate-binding protein
MKSKRIAAVILALTMICSLAALTGCSKNTGSANITVTYVTSPLNVPSIVEKNHSIFAQTMKDAGVESVSYSEITSGADQTQALASGDIQFLYAVGATSVLLSAANGADIKVISMYSRSPKAFCLFSGDESINSPADLRGKTIAGPQGTILHELLVAYLASGNMTLDDVSFVNTTIPDAMSAMLGGSVDCALLAGAAAYNTQASGAHLVTDGEGLVEATICCAATQKFCDENPAVVEAFLKGQQAVLDFMAANEQTALQEAAEYLDLAPAAVADMFGYYDFDMTIRDSDIAAMESTMRFMLANGMIENEVDVSALVIR